LKPVSDRYRTIVADPPWPYRWTGDSTSARSIKYPTMGMLEIAELPVSSLAAAEAHLYLWITADFNRRGEGSRLVQWWGFEYVGEIVWAKPGLGMGRFPRITHEFLCVGRRGGLPFERRDVKSVQQWPNSARHSEKPDAAYDLIETNSPGPRLEMFARCQRLGWDTWGNEALPHVEMSA
jgi:N6-adenosine-specific RNA methylase IME4